MRPDVEPLPYVLKRWHAGLPARCRVRPRSLAQQGEVLGLLASSRSASARPRGVWSSEPRLLTVVAGQVSASAVRSPQAAAPSIP